jgi:hypothetical protein
MIGFRQGFIVALGGCILAGCAADQSQSIEVEPSIKINRTNDAVVARVNNTSIYRSDVHRAAQAQGLIDEKATLATDDPVFLATVDELIDQRLLSLDAIRTGVLKTPEAQRRLLAARERILGNTALKPMSATRSMRAQSVIFIKPSATWPDAAKNGAPAKSSWRTKPPPSLSRSAWTMRKTLTR